MQTPDKRESPLAGFPSATSEVPAFLYLEKGRLTRPRGAGVNAVEKAKTFKVVRQRAFYEGRSFGIERTGGA